MEKPRVVLGAHEGKRSSGLGFDVLRGVRRRRIVPSLATASSPAGADDIGGADDRGPE